MVEVAEEFRLQQETLHLAIGLLDRFLDANQSVPRCVLQLLAVTCILLAAKGLEVGQPTVEQLCAVTAHHVKPADILRMERVVLEVLEFRLTAPSSYTFMHLLAQACYPWITPAVLSLAMYMCELAVLEYGMARYPHSCRAAAALLLAQLSIGDRGHLPRMAAVLGALDVPGELLQPCMAALLHLQQVAYSQARHLAPLRAKFGASCWCEVAGAPPLPAVPAWPLFHC